MWGVAACSSLLAVLAVSETNITLVNFPVNLTSWRISLHDALGGNHSLFRPLATRLSTALNDTVGFLRNGSIGCTPQGGECIPDVPSCCPSTTSGHLGSLQDEDLQCLPSGDGGVHRCSLVTDSDDVAALRLNALEYGDSAGVLESHPWVNSWEFQSRSEAEREELQAAQDAEWKKHWKPSSQENFWLKTYEKLKKEAIEAWKDLRKMKKLKEVKDNLIEKKNKRLEVTVPPVEVKNPETQTATKFMYPDELSEENVKDGEQPNTESEESIIKFSDELPKREKKLDFRLDDIIKDAVDLASQKLKKKTNQGSRPANEDNSVIPSLVSAEELLRLDEIQGTVDKLMKEINELKKLKTQQENEDVLNIENKVTGPNIDELIKKHVRNILDEKRRLYELRHIEEAKRFNQEGGLKA